MSEDIKKCIWDPNTQNAIITPSPPARVKNLTYMSNGSLIASKLTVDDIAHLFDRVKALEEALIERDLLGGQ